MKKRMIAGLMAVMMTMSLAACGSSAGSSDASAQAPLPQVITALHRLPVVTK